MTSPKEFHFHTYFFQNNEESKLKAYQLYHTIKKNDDHGHFVAKVGKFNIHSRGPHPIGSWETWVPVEYFTDLYKYFLHERNGMSVLIHPLTKLEMKDHTTDAVWMGEPLPLDLSVLKEELPEIPLQFPELKLGYSAESL